MTRVADDAIAPRFLGAEPSSRLVRPLLRWNDGELEAVVDVVGAALANALRGWSSGPAFDEALGAVGTGRAAHAQDEPELVAATSWAATGPGGAPLRAVDEAPASALRAALFGDASPAARDEPRLADAASDQAWAEVLAAAAKFGGAVSAPASELARAWSGAVLVDLAFFGARLRLLLDAEAVAHTLRLAGLRRADRPAAASPAPVTPLHAVTHARLVLEARFASFDIGLGDLMSLRVGDVLRTGHPVDRPAQVVAAGADTPLCAGWIGRRERSLAVELARLQAPTPR